MAERKFVLVLAEMSPVQNGDNIKLITRGSNDEPMVAWSRRDQVWSVDDGVPTDAIVAAIQNRKKK